MLCYLIILFKDLCIFCLFSAVEGEDWKESRDDIMPKFLFYTILVELKYTKRREERKVLLIT